jgi:hypothetical protein
MLDSRNFTYISLTVLLIATIALLIATRLSLGLLNTGVSSIVWFVTPFLPSLIYRSEGIAWLDRTICGFQCFGLFFLISFIGCLASYPMALMSSGWVDGYLLAADRLIGLDWLHYWTFTTSHPLYYELLGKAYMCIAFTPAAVIAALAGTGNFDRLYRFLAAHLICIVVTDVSLLCFPATSPAAHFLSAHAAGRPMAGIAPIAIIQGLRDGTISTIQLSQLTGLIAVPSFHAEACVLYSWATWSLKKGRYAFLAVNGLMMLSTPIIGGHYFSDVLAGILVAGGVIAACTRFEPAAMRLRTRGVAKQALRPATLAG